MAWSTAGIITNPTVGQILADTGALAAVSFVPTIMCWSTQSVGITLHHRNATNTADLHTQQMNLSTFNNNFEIYGIPTSVTLGLNERLTITVDEAFIGQIQCSILTT